MIIDWLEPRPDLTPDSAIIEACGGDDFLAAILVWRGFHNANKIRGFLSPDFYSPTPPEHLPDLVHGSELVRETISSGKPILVWGDFDVDGQTSTALLVDALQRLGADVRYYVPNRMTEAHGIKLPSLKEQIAQHQPHLLITCDTGITEYEALDWLKSQTRIIVTDHHDLGDHLPDVDAVINPRRLPHNHPLASLPGVGVAYKLMQHVYTALGRQVELPRLLDLVALGIIADVASQTADTRYLLQIGLERLRQTNRIGLLALMEVANVQSMALASEQISYQLGPRLNAAGRLGDARLSVELLITSDRARARFIAQQLEGYNTERRLQTRQIEAEAAEMIAATPSLLDSETLVIYHPRWNPGILGIVANRLSERYQRPVVLLTAADEEAGRARGSGRAIAGYDISTAIALQADILHTFGGHPGAAGLSLDIVNIDIFRDRVSAALAATKTVPELPQLKIDALIPLEEISLNLASRVRRLSPFGEGNPPVVLATKGLHLSHTSFVGRNQDHRRLTVSDENGRNQVIMWWGGGAAALPHGTFDIAYTIEMDERRDPQLNLVSFRECGDQMPEIIVPTIDVQDYRQAENPIAALEHVISIAPEVLIWAEGYSRQQHPTWKRRTDLAPAETLILYTTPPDPQTLHKVLDVVQPKTIYVFAPDPALPDLNAFLNRLSQTAQNVIDHRHGQADIDVLCGATAQSVRAVRAGLDYLAAQGQFAVTWPDNASVKIMKGLGIAQADKIARVRLETALREVEAYRRYFRNAPVERLVE